MAREKFHLLSTILRPKIIAKKIKKYISLGLPVITTDVFDFSREIRTYNAGVVMRYFTTRSFVAALTKITRNQLRYKKGVRRLARKYYYKKLYPALFAAG